MPAFNSTPTANKWLLFIAALLVIGCQKSQLPEPKPIRQVIHVCDWHYVPKESFAADLRTENPEYTDEEIDQHYAQHLVDVEAVQAEQIQHLRMGNVHTSTCRAFTAAEMDKILTKVHG